MPPPGARRLLPKAPASFGNPRSPLLLLAVASRKPLAAGKAPERSHSRERERERNDFRSDVFHRAGPQARTRSRAFAPVPSPRRPFRAIFGPGRRAFREERDFFAASSVNRCGGCREKISRAARGDRYHRRARGVSSRKRPQAPAAPASVLGPPCFRAPCFRAPCSVPRAPCPVPRAPGALSPATRPRTTLGRPRHTSTRAPELPRVRRRSSDRRALAPSWPFRAGRNRGRETRSTP